MKSLRGEFESLVEFVGPFKDTGLESVLTPELASPQRKQLAALFVEMSVRDE